MNTQSAPAAEASRTGAWAASARRIRSLARAELRLLIRNKTAMFTAIALPVFMVAMLSVFDVAERSDVPIGAFTTTLLVGMVLLFVVYYNLVAAYVGRREELVLKRLRVGEVTDAEILAGTALPSLVIAVVQVVLVGVGVAVVVGVDMPVNPLLAVLGLVAGAVVFVLLAGASTRFTRNVEMAQVSTMPVMLVCIVSSGMITPLTVLPDALASVFRVLPLTPVIELMNLGLAGMTWDGSTVSAADTFGAAVAPAAVALAWIAIGGWALRRWFVWEPRR